MTVKLLYLTADEVGAKSGGGIVTLKESNFLSGIGDLTVLSRTELYHKEIEDPWGWDVAACKRLNDVNVDLCHIYAGTFSETVKSLKEKGVRVSYTAAAHCVETSKREHEKLGVFYARNYPHLTDPTLWQKYLAGYKAADVLICPSQHSANVMRGFGCINRIEVIPHGVELPEKTAPLPDQFRVGYLGAVGPDKGIVYLLQAWKQLNYKNAVLILAGRDSTHPWTQELISSYGGGNVCLAGWQQNVHDFYNSLSLYVQPSVTEGWGCEVVESMSCGRLCLCSDGAGAVDAALDSFPATNVEVLASKIDYYKRNMDVLIQKGRESQEVSLNYTWDKIRERYKKLWLSLLKEEKTAK